MCSVTKVWIIYSLKKVRTLKDLNIVLAIWEIFFNITTFTRTGVAPKVEKLKVKIVQPDSRMFNILKFRVMESFTCCSSYRYILSLYDFNINGGTNTFCLLW